MLHFFIFFTSLLYYFIFLSHSKEPIKLYIHDRDSLPGAEIFTEMIKAMEKSRKIILVLSNSYLRSSQCRGQADLAGRGHYSLVIVLENQASFAQPIFFWSTKFPLLKIHQIVYLADISSSNCSFLLNREFVQFQFCLQVTINSSCLFMLSDLQNKLY